MESSTSHLEELKHDEAYDDHLLPLGDLCARYSTDASKGLSGEEASRRLQRDGPNRLPEVKEAHWLKLVLAQFFGPFSILLWIAHVLCVITYFVHRSHRPEIPMDMLSLAIVILIIILLSGAFGYLQEKHSSSIIASFQKMVKPTARVQRDAAAAIVPAENIVVGDVVIISMGDTVPADMRVIESHGCKVDNSALSGESEPVTLETRNTDRDPQNSANMAFFSTNVVEGWAKGVVIRTAGNSTIGRLAELTATIVRRETPLDRDIRIFVYWVGAVGVVAGVFLLALFMTKGYGWPMSVIIALGVLIAIVPEGLPLTVSASLTLTAKRMAAKNCLVKSLEAVVTLGSTSVICSDKTGTLTLNKMTVMKLWYNGMTVRASDVDATHRKDPTLEALIQVAVLCNRAQVAGGRAVRNSGDASETAIIGFVEERFACVTEMREEFHKVYEEPFNSTKKYQLTIHEIPGSMGHLLALKGAPEKVLELSSKIRMDGKDMDFSPDLVAQVTSACEAMATEGQRVLAFGKAIFGPKVHPQGFKFNSRNVHPEKKLVFIGLVSLEDPPREAVPEAVMTCRRAGIKVIMITGDHPTTAKSIAKEVGIFSSERETALEVAQRRSIPVDEVDPEDAPCLLMTGPEMLLYSKDRLGALMDRFPEIVFARTSPTQKLLIVESLQTLGHVVAVTGDGVNDTPALKEADVGVSMGITGSDVSKDAADIILLDDNFATIVSAVEEGRVISDNLQKSIAYVLSSNVPEVASFLVQVMLGLPLPLSVVLVLVIDTVTDMWPSISLAYEKPEENVMRRRPINTRSDGLITARLLGWALLQVGVLQALAALVTYFIVYLDYGFHPYNLLRIGTKCQLVSVYSALHALRLDKKWTYQQRQDLTELAQSATFVSIVWTQMTDLLVCRTRRDSLWSRGCTNWQLNIGLFLDVAVTGFIVYTPGVNSMLRTRPVRLQYMVPGIIFSACLLLVEELRRLYIRKHPRCWLQRNTFYA